MILQMEPWFGEEEKKEILSYLDEGGWFTEFKRTEKFENLLAEFTSAKHCIVFNNGTISLTLAAISGDIGPGDEVIVPNYSMIATPNSVKMLGAIPVFVDVEPETLCLDISKVKEAMTSKTKAIIFVNANGRNPTYPIENLLNLCKEYKLFLIEDSAQSLGSRYPDGVHQGLKGDVGSFSFSAPKIISTGQGGCLITNNDEIAFKLRRLKDFGRSGGGNDIHDWIGYNFKFTELQACVGIAQMAKLSWRIERKKQIYSKYKKYLENTKGINLFSQDIVNTTPWFIDCIAEQRNKLQDFLKTKNIGTRIMYPPINQQKAYQVEGSFPTSELIGQRGLWLPSASQITDSQIEFICESINEFYENS
ncbi:MAG: DegT/DnrJ/EryC1/StrS family aminotransferase [Saprospiraceae bacterium]|nr:DegT/DnrJ/EryC1/StrS family aminotransferase [Saprospiraceae bacterium]